MRRLALAILVALTIVAAVGTPASAEDDTDQKPTATVNPEDSDEHSAGIAIVYSGSKPIARSPVPANRRGTGNPWKCYYYDYRDTKSVTRNDDGTYTIVEGGTVNPLLYPAGDLEAGKKYVFMCFADGEQKIHASDGGYLVVSYDPNRPAAPLYQADPSFEITRLIAEGRLTIGAPVARFSPPANVNQLVGVPTWFWIDTAADTDWQSPSITVELPEAGVTARLIATAKPVDALEFRPGDKSKPVFCNGPGIAYSGQRDDATTCRHRYFTSSGPNGYQTQLIVHYTVRWEAAGYPGGDLPDLESQPAATTLVVKGTEAVGRAPTR